MNISTSGKNSSVVIGNNNKVNTNFITRIWNKIIGKNSNNSIVIGNNNKIN